MSRKIIRYKVVKNDRISCFVPKGSKYCLRYEYSKIVKAIPGSFGIMVFKTRSIAINWSSNHEHRVLKVETFGKCKIPKILCMPNSFARRSTSKLKQFYRIFNGKNTLAENRANFLSQGVDSWWIYPPGGTECYPEVKVLE